MFRKFAAFYGMRILFAVFAKAIICFQCTFIIIPSKYSELGEENLM
jgi:hypothetical protein